MTDEPAFPSTNGIVLGELKSAGHHGMTLRDYFAAKAMQGLMGRVWGDTPADELFAIWAESSYAIADAMLAVRAAKKQEGRG